MRKVKVLSISSLQTDYINLDSSSCSVKTVRNLIFVQTKCTFCGGANHPAEKCFKKIRNDEGKSCAAG